MSGADAGQNWVSECAKCFAMFRDSPDTAGVCPRCGHENHYSDEGDLMPKKKAVTARCRDCPKTYTITGDQLRNLVAVHELKGHIVDIEKASGKA